MKEDVEKDQDITEVKQLYEEISQENMELKGILTEKVQLAFKI